MRSLPLRLCGSLLCVVAVSGCGQDSEQRYAGLEVAEVSPMEGPGYRLRYLAPPWELIKNDPLATGKVTVVPFGESPSCTAASAMCLAVEPATSTVLEIERPSITPTPGVVTYPKYRLEASVVRCEPGALPSSDLCADHLADGDAVGRAREAGGDQVFSANDGENDFGQHYREVHARNLENQRYRRIVYFATGQREAAVRLYLEANPSLKEEEVTRMVHAFEVVDPETAAP